MSKYNIEQLIQKGESETVEFKSFVPPLPSISKLFSSFANTKGGIIVFGIHDDHVVGISMPEHHVIDLCNKALSTINPKPQFSIVFENYQNKKIAILEIGHSDDIVLSSDDIGYYREETVTKQLTSSKIIEKVKTLPTDVALKMLSENIEKQSNTISKLTEQIEKANNPWKTILNLFFGFLFGILASYIANMFS